MKKLLCVALCAVAGSACAATSNLDAKSNTGFYVGAQVGYADSTFKQGDFGGTKLDHSGFAGRINVGYLFTPNLAVEVGGAYLPNVKWSTNGVDTVKVDSRYLFDLFVKGILPLQNNFSVFGKAGLAYYHQDWKLIPAPQAGTDNAVVPALGLGLSYNINSQLSADVDYTYYFKKGDWNNVEHYFAGTHFIGVGLSYNFGA